MMRVASSPDASTFLLRMPWSREIERLNLGRPMKELTSDCVAVLGFEDEEMTVYPCRRAGHTGELPLFYPPSPRPEATPRLKYDESLKAYIAKLKELRENGEEGKIVAARIISAPPKAYREEIFQQLSHLYPSAFVFYLSTPECGTWIGASPELLLRRKDDHLFTMSLAGTRPLGSSGEWDEKNIREQAMVTTFICETFRKNGLEPEYAHPTTRQAGPVEHILTEISARIPDNFTMESARKLITDLSPTPALSGLPREMAMKMIRQHENFKRHLYGGCIGRVWDEKNWCFFVNLRSALLTTRATYLIVGGGITALSEPVKEWEETELKAITLLKAFAPNSIHIPGVKTKPIVIGRRKRRRRPKF